MVAAVEEDVVEEDVVDDVVEEDVVEDVVEDEVVDAVEGSGPLETTIVMVAPLVCVPDGL